MATAEKEIIDVNQLYRKKDGSIGRPSELYYGNTRVMEACIKKGNSIIKVFNIANYTLTVPDSTILVQADGTEPSVDYESYKTDHDGSKTNISADITWVPELGPNGSEDDKTGSYIVKQTVSDMELYGSYRQLGRTSYYVYSDFSITSANYVRIPASGTGTTPVQIVVGYIYYRTKHYTDGTSESPERKSGTSTSCRVLSHNSYYTHATLDTSTGTVTAESLKDSQYNNDITLFTINRLAIDIYVDKSRTLEYTGAVSCTQQKNVPSSSTTYNITCSAPDKVSAVGGDVDIEVNATKTTTTTWTSGYSPSPVTANDTATVTSNVGSFPYGSTVTGEGSVTLRVPAWSETKDRSITVTATASDSKTYDTATITQLADTVEYKWGKPVITAIYCASDIPANGGVGVAITARYTQTQYKITQSGGSVVYDTDEGTIVVDSVSGNPLLNNARVSGAVVYADAWGAEPENRQPVFTVTSVVLTANGVTSDPSSGLTCSVYQAENKVVSTSTTYYLTLSASGTPVAALGGSATISVSAKYTDTDTYTSGAQATSDKLDAKASLSTTGGTLGASSLTGDKSTTLSFGENYDEQSYYYTVTAECGDKKKTVGVSQSAATYEFEITSLTPSVGADGGSVSLSVTSKRNGKEQSFTTDNVSVSGLSGVGKSVTNHGSGSFSVVLDVPANISTSERSFTVSLAQPNSGRTASTTVTQSGAVDERGIAFIRITASMTDSSSTAVSYTVSLEATDTDKYKGGTLENVYVRICSSLTGGTTYASKLLGSEVIVPEGGKKTYSGTLTNALGEDAYLGVYYNSTAFQKAVKPVTIMT